MRTKIKRFLKLRKQNDAVKIIVILAIAGSVCFANVCYHAWGIYQYVNTPVEYILEGAMSERRMEELRQSKDVAEISRQREQTVSILYDGVPASISCTVLEKEYMEKMFGKKCSAGTKRFYMNESAFQEMQQESEGNGAENGMIDGEIEIRYCESEEAENYKTAKLIIVKNKMPEEKSFIYTTNTAGQSWNNAETVRIRFEKHDLDGLRTEQFRKQGYTIDNENEVIREEYEFQNKMIHIQTGLFSCSICLIAVISGRKCYRYSL